MDVQPDQGRDLFDRQLGMIAHKRARRPRIVVQRWRHGLARVHGGHRAEIGRVRPSGRVRGGEDDGRDLLGQFAALQDGDEREEEVVRLGRERRNRGAMCPHHGVPQVADFDHDPHDAQAVFQVRNRDFLEPRSDFRQCVVGF